MMPVSSSSAVFIILVEPTCTITVTSRHRLSPKNFSKVLNGIMTRMSGL